MSWETSLIIPQDMRKYSPYKQQIFSYAKPPLVHSSEIHQEFSNNESEEEEEVITSAEIKEILKYYEKVTDFIKKKHPEKVHTGRITAQFNDICLTHFRNILKSRQK